jgi:hypothetical protein
MAQPFYESVIFGVFMTLGMFFWIWVFRRLYLNGWRPVLFVLIAIGWQRLKFYFAWLRFSRRYDKVHNFIDLANEKRRAPTAGLLDHEKGDDR